MQAAVVADGVDDLLGGIGRPLQQLGELAADKEALCSIGKAIWHPKHYFRRIDDIVRRDFRGRLLTNHFPVLLCSLARRGKWKAKSNISFSRKGTRIRSRPPCPCGRAGRESRTGADANHRGHGREKHGRLQVRQVTAVKVDAWEATLRPLPAQASNANGVARLPARSSWKREPRRGPSYWRAPAADGATMNSVWST